MTGAMRRGLSWAGLLSGPLAWAVSSQGNYALASWPCTNIERPTAWIALALVLASLLGGILSWTALRSVAAAPAGAVRKPRTERFLAGIGIALALLFALGIALQGFAGMVFNGCEV